MFLLSPSRGLSSPPQVNSTGAYSVPLVDTGYSVIAIVLMITMIHSFISVLYNNHTHCHQPLMMIV
jgi:hypothetical protein